MTQGRPCPVVPLGAGERSSVGGGGGWAQPTRPLPGFARQRACFSGRGLRPRPEKRRRPRRPAGRAVRGAAAFGGRGAARRAAPRPAKQKARAEGKASGPALFRTLRVQPPPPLRQSFLQRQKGKGKARPHDLWGLAHETLSGRGTATAPPLGQSPGPRYPGPGGFIRTAAGYYRKPPAAVVARLSPCAQHRRGRSTAVGVAPQGD